MNVNTAMEILLSVVTVTAFVMTLTALIAFRRMFRDFDDFVECNRMAHQPLWISWWRGEAGKDAADSSRLAAWWAIVLFHGFVALCLSGFIASIVDYVSKHPEMPT